MERLVGSKVEFATALSRRRFLQDMGVGLSMTWGGLRVFAQPATGMSEPENSNSRVGRNFVYGTHFYHPQSGPRPDQFRAMIDAIANKYQFNIIRIYPCWDYYNPKPGVFVFDDLEQLLSICDEFDVRVLMTLFMESAPYWIEEAYPETRFVDATGTPHHLEGSGSSYSGGLPGLCWDWEVVRQAAEQYIHALAKLSAPHRSLYAYDLWNEPQIVRELGGSHWATVPEKLFCYCEGTIAEFQSWLERRYGSLDRLNQAWIRRFPDWKAIDPPRQPIQMYTDWMDWRQFIQERTTTYLRLRAKYARDVDSKHIIETHTSHFPPLQPAALDGTQGWRMAEALEVFGCSFYPLWHGGPVYQGAAWIDVTRSYAAGKDFWITELQASHGNEGFWRSPPMRPREIRRWNWMAVAGGAKGIIYWTYVAEGTGREASGFGLVARSGEPTKRAEEAAKANRLIQVRWDLLKDYRPKPEVAILFDQDNALLTFAMSGDEKPSTASFGGYYKALWNLDFWVDFIEPASINNAHYKVLVVPWHLLGKPATCESLRSFAEQGGTVILETTFAAYDEHYYYNPVIPGNGLDEAFGYRERESIMIEEGKLPVEAFDHAPSGANPYQALIEFSSPVNARVKAHTFLTPIQVSSATPIATCRRWTVAAMKKVGRGEVYYIGTNLGATIQEGDSGGIDVVRAIVSRVVRPPVNCSGKLRPRLIQGSEHGLLTVFNDTDMDQTGTVTITAGYHRATDIYSGKQYAIKESKIDISVPFKDVAVLDLV